MVQEQLKGLNQAYSDLSQHCSDHTAAAEEVGRLVLSFFQYLPLCLISCQKKAA